MNPQTLGVLIPILVPLGSFAMVVLIVYFVMKNQANARARRHEEVMALIEKGQFDPDMLEKLDPGKKPKSPLYAGCIWLGIGVGASLAMFISEKGDWGWGLVPVFIGLALLIYYFIDKKSKKNEQARSV